jgi:hypothetical protein
MRILLAGVLLLVASPALAGLSLELELASTEIEHEGALEYVIRFYNRGPEEVRYFEPLHPKLTTFPSVRLVRAGETRGLRPYDPPFQSRLVRGLQGRIVRLGPGETKEYRFRRDRFLAVDRNTQRADWFEPRRLPDGEFEIHAVYVMHDGMLPHLTEASRPERKRVPGIFTGTLRSAPATFRVRPPSRPHVRISVPDRGTTEVVVTLANPGSADLVLTGPAHFEIASKMYGSATATLGESPLSVAVPAGESAERRVDLRHLTWRRKDGPPECLDGIVHRGIVHLRFWVEGETPLASDGIWARVPEVPQRGLEGVSVRVSHASPDGVRPGRPVTVTVVLENRGADRVGLVRRLAFPRELVLRLEDAAGARRSRVSTTGRARVGGLRFRPVGESHCRIARGLSWNRDRFERVAAPTRDDLVWLEPGGRLVRQLELTRLLATGLAPGRYLLRAGYRNGETGGRLGLAADRRPATGIVWSESVLLVVE